METGVETPAAAPADKPAEKCRACRVLASPWVAGSLAGLELVLGFVLLGFPYLLGISAAWVGGFVLLFAGMLRLVQGMRYAGNRGWNLLAGCLYLGIGVFMVFMPMMSMQIWTLLIGITLFAGGLVRLGVALGMMRMAGSFWRFFSALVSVALGAMVIWGWPASSFWFIGTLVAVEMIFSGWTLLFLAIAPNSPKSLGGNE